MYTNQITRMACNCKPALLTHTGANFITMLITRARANSISKNHTLMCRNWKMDRNFFSSLDNRDITSKWLICKKKSNNPKIYLVTITVWALAHFIGLMLITRSKSGYLTKFSQKVPLSNYQPCPMMNHFFPFLHSACMNFAKIGYGPCYYHWIEICAGVGNV